MQAFVYLLQDLGVTPNMFYIGFKTGDFWQEIYDKKKSYKTSSNIVKKLLEQRPQDFRWFLVSCGSKEEMLEEETKLLKSVDAARNLLYYNKCNGDRKFYCTEYTKERNSKISRALYKIPKPMKTREKMRNSKIGIPRSIETTNKISFSLLGKPQPWHQGKPSGALGKHWKWKDTLNHFRNN